MFQRIVPTGRGHVKGRGVVVDWPDRTDRAAVLRQVNDHCRELHDRLTDSYFEYPVEDLAGR